MVCIDNFAMKKRETYGTMMVDIDSHRVIDMIESREYKAVKEWLETYPNIIIVSRDGSITYHNAITDALPEAEQISDRFHLIKNLTMYIKDYLKKELSVNVSITSVNNNIEENVELSKSKKNRKLTLEEKYTRMMEFIAAGHNKTYICQSLNMDSRTYDRLKSSEPIFETNSMKKHKETLLRKKETVKEVRLLKKKGLSNREISRRTGLNTSTIRNYLDKKFQPVHASYGKLKGGVLTPFISEINNMLKQGSTGKHIESQIREKGYNGSDSNLRHYITKWKNQQKQISAESVISSKNIEYIERKNIFKFLYFIPEKVKAVTKEQFESIKTEYPSFRKVYDILWDFKNVFETKSLADFEAWIFNAQKLNIREINSFIEGIQRDIDAVKNAVVYPYSNGLAEGSINKLKMLKRVMYGRCKFETFKNKVLGLEKFRTFNQHG